MYVAHICISATVILLFLIVFGYTLSFEGLHTIRKIKYYTVDRYYIFDQLFIIVSTEPFVIFHIDLNLVLNFRNHV